MAAKKDPAAEAAAAMNRRAKGKKPMKDFKWLDPNTLVYVMHRIWRCQ